MKIHCPYHADDTPSMKVYGEYAYCFGCGISVKTTDTSIKVPTDFVPKERENARETIQYIESLPLKAERGFLLHYDASGYYLIWPEKEYYLKRTNDPRRKYIGPSGHTRPLYIRPSTDTLSKTLIVIEGEFNAESTYRACGGFYTIVSPGGAGNFKKSELVNYCLPFSKVCIIVDKDPAGVLAGFELKQLLLAKDRRVVLYPMEEDMNKIHVTLGLEAVLKQLDNAFSMF